MRKTPKNRTKAVVPISGAGINAAPTSAFRKSPWCFTPEDAPPLAWWRTLPSDLLGDAEVLQVRSTLDKIVVLRGGNTFGAALRGEVTAAVAVALSLMPIWDVTLDVDIAMTAVLRSALEADGAAALVLAHVLARAEIGHPFATELSASWPAHRLRHSLVSHRFTKEGAVCTRERDELPAASVGGQP